MTPSNRNIGAIGVAASLVLTAFGCAIGSSASDSPGSPPGVPEGAGGGTINGADAGSGSGSGGAGGAALPPEVEVESSYQTPVATGHFIWVANPVSGRVSYIDATSLAIQSVEAGDGPTYLAPIPSATDDAVIVLNVLSDDATLLRASNGALTIRTISGVADGANAWTVSPDGRWAIAWTNSRQMAGADQAFGFQDVTVIDLQAPASAAPQVILEVGYRPVMLVFAADSARAFAVTEDGVSVIDVTAAGGPQVTGTVALTDDPTEDADTRDVSITPSGTLAVVRREGSPAVRIVDLSSGAQSLVQLSGPVTDLDLTDSGDRAVAVVRDTAEVAILPLAAGAPPASAVVHVTVTGEVVGSVVLAPGGQTALLFSNAADIERLTVLDLSASVPSYRTVKLHGPVLSVIAAPDGKHAVVIHGGAGAAAADPDGGAGAGAPAEGGARADGGGGIPATTADAGAAAATAAGAFSLVPLDGDGPVKIQATDAPPRAVAISPAGDRALVTVSDPSKQIYGVYLGLLPSLAVQHFPLASPPVAVGVVPAANRGYVAQQHPEGRATFISLDDGQARTLTGFEIGAQVVDWSQP